MGEPEETPKALVAIKKGADPWKLERLALIQTDRDEGTLAYLRKALGSSGYMKRSDRFLSRSWFPIHKKDERNHKWKNALWPIQSCSSNEKGTENEADVLQANSESVGVGPQLAPVPVEKDSEGSNNSERIVLGTPKSMLSLSHADYPFIAILSTEGETREVPKLPGKRKPIFIPDSTIAEAPDALTVNSSNAATSGETLNTATLNNKQLAQMLDLNGIFCGSSIIDHPTSRICAKIFKPPSVLRDLIRASDAASVETHTTLSSHHSNLIKYGFGEAAVYFNTPWVRVSALYSSPNNIVAIDGSDNSTSYTTAIYRYSRAIVRLPVASLKPTKEFQDDLANALKGDSDEIKREQLGDFFATYGQCFATEVHLGGHLHITESSRKIDQNEIWSIERDVRASLATIVNLGGFGQRPRRDDHQTSFGKSGENLGVEVVGGNTLLTANLALWPQSMMPYTNWRVTKLAKLKLLTDFPQLFNKHQRQMVFSLYSRDDENEVPIGTDGDSEKTR